MKRNPAGQSAARFDALKLAEAGGMLAGELDPAQLPRLTGRVVPAVAAPGARIAWQIAGGKDAFGHQALTLTLKGKVFQVCQRCLRPFAVPLEQQTLLLLARDELELARLDAEEPEVVLASVPLDPVTLVEDELLLSLPYAPRHANDVCMTAATRAAASQDLPSPFARLAALKTGRRSKD